MIGLYLILTSALVGGQPPVEASMPDQVSLTNAVAGHDGLLTPIQTLLDAGDPVGVMNNGGTPDQVFSAARKRAQDTQNAPLLKLMANFAQSGGEEGSMTFGQVSGTERGLVVRTADGVPVMVATPDFRTVLGVPADAKVMIAK